jgi:DNA end-binding protein Ku
MKSDKVVGVSKLVMGRRERAVILEPRDEGIVLWSLRFGDEVRPEDSYFEDIEDEADPDHIPLVQKLIKQKSSHWSPNMVSDPIQTSLLKLIDEKKKALKPKKAAKGKAAEAPPKNNVVNIMDALRKSLEADLKGRKAG